MPIRAGRCGPSTRGFKLIGGPKLARGTIPSRQSNPPQGRAAALIRETVGHLRDLPALPPDPGEPGPLWVSRRRGTPLHLDGLVRPVRACSSRRRGPAPRPGQCGSAWSARTSGPTFVKLGQILSTRPDLLPEAYTTELAQLRDHVKPFSFAEVEAILAEEYGRPASEVFAVDRVGTAGVGVDLAGPPGDPPRRPDDRAQDPPAGDRQGRPGRPRHPQEPGPARRTADARRWSLTGRSALARELERTLKRELDLSIERRTMERCRGQFAREPMAHIPEVFREYCDDKSPGDGADRRGRA